MAGSKESSFFLMFTLVVSVFGLVSIPLLLSRVNSYQIDFLFSKPLVGLLYAGVCIAGISAVFYPNKCEKTFMFSNRTEPREQDGQGGMVGKMQFSGHHPDCGAFSANRITLNKRAFCAACTGLFFGAVVALIGALLYFFVGFVPFPADWVVFFVGYSGLFLGLAQFKFRGYFKLIANAWFVLGSYIVLVSVDLLGKSFFLDLYVFGLIIFLLLTRILISEWNNKRICSRCNGCKLQIM